MTWITQMAPSARKFDSFRGICTFQLKETERNYTRDLSTVCLIMTRFLFDYVTFLTKILKIRGKVTQIYNTQVLQAILTLNGPVTRGMSWTRIGHI